MTEGKKEQGEETRKERNKEGRMGGIDESSEQIIDKRRDGKQEREEG